MAIYVVNDNDENNPGNNHEVHTEVHAKELKISNYTQLGDFDSCAGALKKAKKTYPDADGCKNCCSECHLG